MTPWKTMALLVPLALLAACTDSAQAPAEAAMAAAGAAMDSLRGDATRYAPDEVKKLQSSYEVGKASMANKDYKGTLTFTKDIPEKARELIAKADAARTELAKAWKEAGDGFARTIDAAKQRLSGGKRPPAGLDKITLARAHAELTSLEEGWTAASEQYKSGDWSGAVARARDLNSKGLKLLESLGAK